MLNTQNNILTRRQKKKQPTNIDPNKPEITPPIKSLSPPPNLTVEVENLKSTKKHGIQRILTPYIRKAQNMDDQSSPSPPISI